MTVAPAFRRLVAFTFITAFLAAAWGGVVRVTGSGLGCPDWPLCHGTFLPQFDVATFIEWFHRFIAILSGLSLAATAL
ncbi:MAG: COX15/CtaA family protein, partial [Candidatus Limnocylindria bacterium]|nr:COX15/CtaA family protein [Candidatus Limnocylindria bacterium]